MANEKKEKKENNRKVKFARFKCDSCGEHQLAHKVYFFLDCPFCTTGRMIQQEKEKSPKEEGLGIGIRGH